MTHNPQLNPSHHQSDADLKKINRIVSASILLLTILTLFFLFSVNQRGFDIADEGFHLLASQFPFEVTAWTNVAHFYTSILFNLVGKNVVLLRMLSEVLIFTSASWFALGLLSLGRAIYPQQPARHMRADHVMMWSMMCLGGLFYYIHFDATPSYNTLNAMMLNAAAGFICYSLAKASSTVHKTNVRLSMLNSLLAGFCLGVILLVKFPTAFALLMLFSIIFVIWPSLPKVSRCLNISMLILGMIAWLVFHIIFLESWHHLWHTFNDGLASFMTFGRHTPISCAARYVREFFVGLIQAIHYFWPIYLLLMLSTWFKKNRYYSLFKEKYFILLLCVAGFYSIKLNFYRGGTTQSMQLIEIYLAWIMLLFFSCLILTYNKKYDSQKSATPRATKRLAILIIFLFILPFAGAFGTANIIILNLTQYMAAWFALIAMLLLMLANILHQRLVFLLGTSLISVFACSQIISAGYIAPYNLNTTIDKQTIFTSIGVPRTFLKLDQASSEFFNKMKLMAQQHGFKPGDDILAFCDMPGIVFALGGKSPIVPWYLTLANAKTTNLWFLQQAPLKRIKKAFILENTSGAAFGMPDLSRLGIHFPTDYELCGEAIWPLTGEWVRLWKAKDF